MIKNYKKILIFLGITAVLLFIIQFTMLWNNNSNLTRIISGDAKGYYSYLEQIFQKHNFGQAPVDYDHIIKVNGHSLIKYYSGTAFLLLPFYLLAGLVNIFFGLPAFSETPAFLRIISLAGPFYLLITLWFSGKILRLFSINTTGIIVTLTAFLFGTNLLTYAVFNPVMSHVYSFFAITLFIFQIQRFSETEKKIHIILCAAILGLIYCIRPVNLLVIFLIPFFIGFNRGYKIIARKPLLILWAISVFLITAFFQHLLWKIQCGNFFVWSYSYEGFYFLQPELLRVLFGFRKGLFIYTPLILISLIGILALWNTDKIRAFWAGLFFLIISYIFSSWWCWSYSDGFGMRPFIDFYIFFIILLAILLKKSARLLRIFIFGLILLTTLLNLVQTYQYRQNIIAEEYMSFSRYRHVFLKTSDNYRNCFGGCFDIIPYNKNHKHLLFHEKLSNSVPDLDSVYISSNKEARNILSYDEHYETNFVFRVNSNNDLYHANKAFAEVNFEKLDLSKVQFHKNIFVISITYPDKNQGYYRAFAVDYQSSSQLNIWKKISYTIMLPKILSENYELRMYIWNKGLDLFQIKNLEIKIYRTA